MLLFKLWESDLDSVGQHSMLYIVFEKYYKGIYCKSNGLGWFARYRTQFLPDHYNDPVLVWCDFHGGSDMVPWSRMRQPCLE